MSNLHPRRPPLAYRIAGTCGRRGLVQQRKSLIRGIKEGLLALVKLEFEAAQRRTSLSRRCVYPSGSKAG